MKLCLAVVALATAAVVPAVANAVILNYSIFGGSSPADTSFYRFNFQLDTDRTPSTRTVDTLRYAPTPISYSLPGSSTVIEGTNSNLGPSFFATRQQGGISLLRLPQGPNLQPRFFGPTLFEGTTAAPIFRTGTFRLSMMPRNVPSDVQIFDYTIRIAAVPEPATWAMMIAGFGLVGAALRRRAVTTVAA